MRSCAAVIWRRLLGRRLEDLRTWRGLWLAWVEVGKILLISELKGLTYLLYMQYLQNRPQALFFVTIQIDRSKVRVMIRA